MTGPAFLPSVADTLLAQFKGLARTRIDAATPQVVESYSSLMALDIFFEEMILRV